MRITNEMVDQVRELIMVGVPPLPAVMSLGATEDEFTAWMTTGATAKSGMAAKLYVAIKEAEARCEAVLVGKIRASATANWQAAAWLAERRFPARYVRRVAFARV